VGGGCRGGGAGRGAGRSVDGSAAGRRDGRPSVEPAGSGCAGWLRSYRDTLERLSLTPQLGTPEIAPVTIIIESAFPRVPAIEFVATEPVVEGEALELEAGDGS
jgi:hypothetical protein